MKGFMYRYFRRCHTGPFLTDENEFTILVICQNCGKAISKTDGTKLNAYFAAQRGAS